MTAKPALKIVIVIVFIWHLVPVVRAKTLQATAEDEHKCFPGLHKA